MSLQISTRMTAVNRAGAAAIPGPRAGAGSGREGLGEAGSEGGGVYVSAGQDDCGAAAGAGDGAGAHGGQGDGGAGLGDQLEPGEAESHGVGDGSLRDRDDIVEEPGVDGEGELAGLLGQQAVGHGDRRGDADPAAGPHGLAGVVGGFRLGGDDGGFRQQALDRGGHPGGQAAAADRQDDLVQAGQAGLGGQLDAQGALAGHDVVVVERPDHGQRAFGGDGGGDLLAPLAGGVVAVHLRAVALDGGELGGRPGRRDDDHGGDAEQPGGQGDGGAVVAR